MSDLRKQIHDHYDARSLPPEKVDAILAKGRAVAAGEEGSKITPMVPRGSRIRRMLAVAASVALLGGIIGLWFYPRSGVDYAAARRVVVGFFAKEHTYSTVSKDPEELRLWALAHGAPAGFQIPPKLQSLPGKACTLLDVDGRPAFLICFMTVDASGKQDGGMVHLVVAQRRDFRNVPRSRTPSDIAEGDWNFATWVDGAIVYSIAAPAPPEKVRRYVLGTAGDDAMLPGTIWSRSIAGNGSPLMVRDSIDFQGPPRPPTKEKRRGFGFMDFALLSAFASSASAVNAEQNPPAIPTVSTRRSALRRVLTEAERSSVIMKRSFVRTSKNPRGNPRDI